MCSSYLHKETAYNGLPAGFSLNKESFSGPSNLQILQLFGQPLQPNPVGVLALSGSHDAMLQKFLFLDRQIQLGAYYDMKSSVIKN